MNYFKKMLLPTGSQLKEPLKIKEPSVINYNGDWFILETDCPKETLAMFVRSIAEASKNEISEVTDGQTEVLLKLLEHYGYLTNEVIYDSSDMEEYKI